MFTIIMASVCLNVPLPPQDHIKAFGNYEFGYKLSNELLG